MFWLDPAFYTALALFIFLGILAWVKVPAAIGKALDARAETIRRRLDEATNLRQEAEDLLKSYVARRASAEQEAVAIIAAAKDEAERLALEARANLEQQMTRRTEAAIAKIAQAERQALDEVKALVADHAIAAAARLLQDGLGEHRADALIDDGIRDLARGLH